MKKLFLSILFVCLSVSALAQAKFPKGTFEVTDLEKAKQTAAAENKPIAFIYTDKTTSCGLCQAATEAYLDAVKTKAVLVYLNSETVKTWWPKIPKNMHQPLNSGKFIPKVVVTDATTAKVLTVLNYEEYKKDTRKAISGLKAALKAQ